MPARFVNIDYATPLLLPPGLRDWVGPDHMVHFIMDAVAALDLSLAQTNERGTGKAQYPPSMMLGLLIYCYATGTFSSRRIESRTCENVAVRFLTADTHPDHDSICKFRPGEQGAFGIRVPSGDRTGGPRPGSAGGGFDRIYRRHQDIANASKHSATPAA
jgi:hypothetical protein